MIRVAVKGLMRRKLRAALTAVAIVLGVAMVSGTYILTDTIEAAFSTVFTQAYKHSDAVITGRNAISQNNNQAGAPSLPGSLLTSVRRLPQVAAASGGISDTAQLVGRNGKVVSHGGAPGLAFSYSPAGRRFNPLTLASGSWPSGPNEVDIDAATAGDQHLSVGHLVGVIARGPVQRYRIAGTVRFAGVSSLGGSTMTIFPLATAQRIFGKQGRYDQINVAAAAGVSPAELVHAIRPLLGPAAEVRTGQAQAQQQTKDTNGVLSIFKSFLLAFGGVALFVGSFVIANTLSITIAQRTRELATLRTLGANRRQVLTSVLLEALVIGLLASVTGLFVGLGLARGLNALLVSFGIDLPHAGTVFKTRTVVVAMLVGVVITLLAALRPALRATRVPPIAAVREGAVLPPSRFARFGLAGAIATIALALAVMLVGLLIGSLSTDAATDRGGDRRGGAVPGRGDAGAQAGPLAGTRARVAGGQARRRLRQAGAGEFGPQPGAHRHDRLRSDDRSGARDPGRRARGRAEDAVRERGQPGVRGRLRGHRHQQLHPDRHRLRAGAPAGTGGGGGVRGSGRRRAGVRLAYQRDRRRAQRLPGHLAELEARRPADAGRLGTDGAFVATKYASAQHLHVGSPLSLQTPSGTRLALTIRGITSPPKGGSPYGDVTISQATFDSVYQDPQNLYAFADMRGGVTPANTRALNAALSGFPDAKVQTKSQFITNQEQGLDMLLNLLYVLLSLSIIVSLFGIVNTLVLTVFERTRELGMLRAVGMSRRQVRRMIRHESVITALLGAALGIPLGVLLALMLGAAIKFGAFTVPWGTLIVFVIAAILAGLVAAIFPARRAGRLNVLEALQYE